MIKIESFYPFAGFLKVNQEFYEDHFVVKTKSISSEREEEYSYDKIAEISDQYNSSGSQLQFAWALLVVLSPVMVFLPNAIRSTPVLLFAIQVLYSLGIVVFVLGFFKHWHIFILDEEGNTLTTIKLTKRNNDSVYEALDWILGKSKEIEEISVAGPNPEIQPVFEYTYFDFSDLQKNTDRFYDERIIGFQNNFLSESVCSLKYKSLSGRIFRGKLGIKVWQTTLSWAMLICSVLIGLRHGFNIISGKPMLYIGIPILILSFALLPLTLVKRNIIGFYGKNGRVAYWAYVNKSDKEKIEKIIEFVQSRIPAENKEASPKE